jgi:hypothetical protein
MAFRTYFSHSYRSEDRNTNKFFWNLFPDRAYFFSVDPKQKQVSFPYLESMMRRSLCFVAVVPFREDEKDLHCSPFVHFEYGLALQARKPGLVFVDNRANISLFPPRDDIVVERFEIGSLPDDAAIFQGHIGNLTTRLTGHHDPERRRSNTVGLLLNSGGGRHYSDGCIRRIKECIASFGFNREIQEVPTDPRPSHEYPLRLDALEFVIADVDARLDHAWLFTYLNARFVPSIKLYRLKDGEAPGEASLPPIISATGSIETAEIVIFWRDEDDLLERLYHHIARLKSERIEFRNRAQGNAYFDSIGRRPATVFISNADSANDIAATLIHELRAQNIQYFHYSEDAAIRTGAHWQSVLRNKVEHSEILVALINEDFGPSPWCKMEVDVARRQGGRVILPYLISGRIPDFLADLQVAPLLNGHVERIVQDVDAHLRQTPPELARRPDTTLSPDARSLLVLAVQDYLMPHASRTAAIKPLLIHSRLTDQLEGEAYSENASQAAAILVLLVDKLGPLNDGRRPRIAALRLVDALVKHFLPPKWHPSLEHVRRDLLAIEETLP